MASTKTHQDAESDGTNRLDLPRDAERWDCPLAIAKAIRLALREMPNFQLDEQERCILYLVALDVITKKRPADPGDLELLKECQDEMRSRNMKTH